MWESRALGFRVRACSGVAASGSHGLGMFQAFGFRVSGTVQYF